MKKYTCGITIIKDGVNLYHRFDGATHITTNRFNHNNTLEIENIITKNESAGQINSIISDEGRYDILDKTSVVSVQFVEEEEVK